MAIIFPIYSQSGGTCKCSPNPCTQSVCKDHCATNYDDTTDPDVEACTNCCHYAQGTVPGCTYSCGENYDPSATCQVEGSCGTITPVPGTSGCTVPRADNYNPCATHEDGSCEIPPAPGGGCGSSGGVNSECCPGETGTACGQCSSGAHCCMCGRAYAPNGPGCACVYVGE